MRRGIIAIIAVIWFAACLGTYFYRASLPDTDRGYTTFNSWAEDKDFYYISDNADQGGIIYRFVKAGDTTSDAKGNLVVPVRKMLTAWSDPDMKGYSIYKIAKATDELYVLAGKQVEKDREKVLAYRIFGLDQEFQPMRASDHFVLEDGQKLSSFTVSGTTSFITALSPDGQVAATYQVEYTQLNPLVEVQQQQDDSGGVNISFNKLSSTFFNVSSNAGSGENAQGQPQEVFFDPRKIKTRSVEAGRFFAEAMYEDGLIYTRYDNSDPDDRFLTPVNVMDLYNGMNLTFMQRITISDENRTFYILIGCIGAAVAIFFPLIFRRRKRVVYIILVSEIVLLVSVVIGIAFIIMQRESIRRDSLDSQLAYTVAGVANSLELPSFTNLDGEEGDPSFYDSSTYLQLQRNMAEQLSMTQAGAGIYDVCYLNLTDKKVYVSSSGKNRQEIEDLYGPVTETVIEEIKQTPNAVVWTEKIQGRDYRIIGVHSQGSGDPGLGVLALSDYNISIGSFWENNFRVFVFGLLVFLVGSIIIVLYQLMQAADLRKLAFGLKSLANGEENIEKPVVYGRDLNMMWNSIFEIDKNVRLTNRAKFQIFEAYYRFAPKKIEKILQKDSITEVHGGDVVQMEGTMALLSTTGQRNTNRVDIERMNRFLSMIEKHQETRDGIYVSNNGDLSRMKVLFIESTETISFGVELLYELREWQQKEYANATILLHYAPFVYGIAGTQNQSAAFLASRETEELEEYMDWFRSIHIPLIVTDTVKEREDRLTDVRYIGFIKSWIDTDGKIDLYEVLDANSGRIRQLKMRTKAQFEEAIRTFYRQDFYLARNAFTEILKEFPEDEIVTWYLFECEYYLNEDADTSDFSGALHLEKHKKRRKNPTVIG